MLSIHAPNFIVIIPNIVHGFALFSMFSCRPKAYGYQTELPVLYKLLLSYIGARKQISKGSVTSGYAYSI